MKGDVESLEHVKGLPWQPGPGRDSAEPPIKIGIPEEEIFKTVESRKKGSAKRWFMIQREHVRRHGPRITRRHAERDS